MQPYDQVFGDDCGGELCPQAEAIVKAMENPDAPPVERMDIQAARINHALEAYDLSIPTDKIQIEDREFEVKDRSLRVRMYTPQGEGPFPILVFAHGGCWTFCSIDSHDSLCRFYCLYANCVVVSVDYSLAPERPFPHGLDDVEEAILWCFENASQINSEPACIAVGGDSAGGNLSAAVAQRLQSHPELKLCLQLLIYPICDTSIMTGGSLDRYANDYFFTRDVLKWTASLYTSDHNPKTPEISPLYGELSTTLAPAHFIIAECDVLRDQAIAYAKALRSAGITVQTNYYRGVPHAFVAMAGALDLGMQALEESAHSLKRAFTQSKRS